MKKKQWLVFTSPDPEPVHAGIRYPADMGIISANSIEELALIAESASDHILLAIVVTDALKQNIDDLNRYLKYGTDSHEITPDDAPFN